MQTSARSLILSAALLLAVAHLSAQTELPIPTALADAHTVYVVNKGVPPKVLENTLKALTAWHRWTLAADAAGADITLTVSAQASQPVYNWALGTSIAIQKAFLTITSPDGTALYGVEFANNPEKVIKALAKRLPDAPPQ